ncbi:MAG: rhomboid family intramembrane serine protease [Rhodobacteraceae bacterium]|nr:rhomboid family intramembrane serine protease [Paracoccaceae bacterium]
MFFPYRDDNPHTITPYVNYSLIAACVAVFIWQLSLGRDGELAVYMFGLIPGELFGSVRIDERIPRPPGILTAFTSMFLHGGFMHLIGNMMYLWIFGDNIEASLGHRRYFLFYVVCGLVAAAAQAFAAPMSPVPMIGASGAISGVLGAYLVLHPRANVRVFVWLLIIITTVNLPAWIVLGVWFLGQLMSSAAVDASQPGVAFMAHIGGFVAGAVLVFFFKKRDVRAFEPAQSRAFQMERRPIRYRRGGSVPRAGWGDGDRHGPWG